MAVEIKNPTKTPSYGDDKGKAYQKILRTKKLAEMFPFLHVNCYALHEAATLTELMSNHPSGNVCGMLLENDIEVRVNC